MSRVEQTHGQPDGGHHRGGRLAAPVLEVMGVRDERADPELRAASEAEGKMLHLSLAADVMNAVGGTPDLTRHPRQSLLSGEEERSGPTLPGQATPWISSLPLLITISV
jgi:hypothetical protein